MHDTALEIGKLFFKNYITKANPSILDVGALSVNGSLRDVAPPNSRYTGIDIEMGEGVDIVLDDAYSFPFPDNSFDAVICTSVFEHDSFFWQTFLEMLRVANSDGFLYINTPSNGVYHAYPQDCWRFYPDSALALKSWAERKGCAVTLVESFIGKRKNDIWNDCVMVFRKGNQESCEYKFIHTDFPSYNARRVKSQSLIMPNDDTEDLLILQSLQGQLHNQVVMTNEQDLRRHLAEQEKESLRSALETTHLKAAEQISNLETIANQNDLRRHLAEEEQNSLRSILENERKTFEAEKLALKREASEQRTRLQNKLAELEHYCHEENELRLAKKAESDWRIHVQLVRRAELQNRLITHEGRRVQHVNDILGARKRNEERAEIALLKNVIASAEQWQQRSWVKRAFHRWRKNLKKAKRDEAKAGYPPLFDSNWYLNTYPDVEAAKIGAYHHYLETGWKEGRNPNPLFSTNWYLNTYPDVRQAGLEPLQHYLESGWKEGRNPHPLFDVNWYLTTYPDVKAAKVEPLQHFITSGWKERRKPTPLFDTEWYLQTNPFVEHLDFNPLQYYVEGGYKEGHFPNPLFDTTWYLESYPEIEQANIEPLQHYLESGWKEGRNPNCLFHTAWYLKNYPEVGDLKVNPLQHYMESGWKEGRNPNPYFDSEWYLANYSDVQKANINPLRHYIEFGAKEIRNPGPNFDSQYYVETYSDVKLLGLNPLDHFLRTGVHEGRHSKTPVELLTTYRDFVRGNIDFIKSTLSKYSSKPKTGEATVSICFIGHSLIRTGAPVFLKELVEKLSSKKDVNIFQIINNLTDKSHLDSTFEKEVRGLAPTVATRDFPYTEKQYVLESVLEWFRSIPGSKVVFANTVTTWEFAKLFHEAGIRVLTYIHERPEVISHLMTKNEVARLVESSENILFSNGDNAKRVSSLYNIPNEKVQIVPSGSARPENVDSETLRANLLERFNIPLDADLILGAGSVELRKSPELFTQTALLILSRCKERGIKEPYFVWFGGVLDTEVLLWTKYDLKHSDSTRYVHFAGETNNLPDYYSITKLFLLTSREESFSLVGLDALSNGVPVIAFDGATGLQSACPDSIITAPYLDTSKMADIAIELLQNPSKHSDASLRATSETKSFTWDNTANAVRKLVWGKKLDDQLRVLVLSHGPPPIEGQKVEGGGLRSWGLAKTLKTLLPEAEIILHYGISSASASPDIVHSGVRVICCEQEKLLRMLSSVDVIIVSYCGYLTGAVLERILPRHLLILDCYVPIYVEVAARDSEDLNLEYKQYIHDVPYWNRALLRGDYFLCANDNQRDFYTGVLSSLCVINPKTYKTSQLLQIPYGIDEDEPVSNTTPVTNALTNKKAKRILWFGGVYPWFDLRTLIDAVKIVSKSLDVELVVVGARNPFNFHPDFVRSAADVIAHGSTPELKDIVHFEEWVDYNDRASWYLDCDIIVSLSKSGIENRYSWRTRTVDFIWSGSLLALNEGDPVAEKLFAANAAVKLGSLEKNDLAKTLLQILSDPVAATTIKNNLKRIRKEFTWNTLVAPLAATIKERFPVIES